MLGTKDWTVKVRIERHGRSLDFWINDHFGGTRDLTDFYTLSEEDVVRAVTLLDEADRQQAEIEVSHAERG